MVDTEDGKTGTIKIMEKSEYSWHLTGNTHTEDFKDGSFMLTKRVRVTAITEQDAKEGRELRGVLRRQEAKWEEQQQNYN